LANIIGSGRRPLQREVPLEPLLRLHGVGGEVELYRGEMTITTSFGYG
jgi:hypothetical protein